MKQSEPFEWTEMEQDERIDAVCDLITGHIEGVFGEYPLRVATVEEIKQEIADFIRDFEEEHPNFTLSAEDGRRYKLSELVPLIVDDDEDERVVIALTPPFVPLEDYTKEELLRVTEALVMDGLRYRYLLFDDGEFDNGDFYEKCVNFARKLKNRLEDV